MQMFKVRWAGELANEARKPWRQNLSDERLVLNQAKRMKQVNATLVRQGFVLSDTDPAGFLIYIRGRA